MIACKRCGKENQEHYKFCLGCGGELSAVPSAAAASQPAADGQVSTGSAPLGGTAPASARGSGPAPATAQTPAPVAPPNGSAAPAAGPVPPPARPSRPALAANAVQRNRVCSTCGREVPPEFGFCGQCGTRMPPGPTTPPAAAAPTQGTRTLFMNRVPSNPKQATRGRLVLIRPDGSEGGHHPLQDGENLIGRGAGPLFENDSYLSPNHAMLVLNQGTLIVQDLGSLNGLFFKMIEEEEIQSGDVFRVGQELLRFDAIPAPEPLEDGTEVMGSPNPGFWGRLSIIIGKDLDGSAFPLFGDAVLLGRERGDILFPEDGYVSGLHARVSHREGRYFLSDLGSSNGTFLRVVGQREVPAGSYVLMGQQLFKVTYN